MLFHIYIFLSIFFPHQILEWWHNICSKSWGRLVKTLIRISENTTHGGPTLLMSKSTKLEFFFRAVKNHNIKFSKLIVYFFREKLIFFGQEKNGNDMTTFDICFSRKFKSHIPPNERGRISPQLVITLIN